MIPEATPQHHLLVIDDDPLLQGLAVRTLRHAGFEVSAADSGESGLALLETTAFALVLLDVMMPGIDGYETCRRLRALPRCQGVPVLMLTGLNDTGSIEQAYEAGATDFLVKPINWTLLAQRVRYALRAAAAMRAEVQSRERFERAQRIACMGSWELSADGRRMTCSPELATVFALPAGSAGGLSPEAFLERVQPADRKAVAEARRAAVNAGTPYQLSFRIGTADGGERSVYEQALPIVDAAGQRTGVEGITQDITERVEAERRISRLAHFDTVTGLANRSHFDELAMPMLERAARLGSGCALLHLDIDRFKSVNDALGQAAGDQVLRRVGERLEASVRSSDLTARVGGFEGCLARIGANAFTLLVVEVDTDRAASLIAERVMRVVSMPIELQGRELVLSASIGIAMYPRDATESSALARCAEQALYAAKTAGRAQHRFFDEAMNASASLRLTREGELRRAIAEGQLQLHYQPQVDGASGSIVGAEALVRWQHPERGLVLPAEFIALAEDSGLILPLTDWVFEAACAGLRDRIDAGLPVVPVAVNVASPSFLRDDLLDQLGRLLERHRLDAGLLRLEVTESMLMKDVPRAVSRLRQLKDRGFGLSLDDFGTGFSSLSYLRSFPIDELKIDRSFVIDVCRGGRDSAIAKSIIALGREFGLNVVAEGVETAAQAELLVRHRCSTLQGYLFARPMPAEQFNALLLRGAIDPAGRGPLPQTPAAAATAAAALGEP